MSIIRGTSYTSKNEVSSMNETTQTIKKWKFEVVADSSGKFCGNGQTFDTKEAAEEAARNLESRWILVREWRVVEV